MNSSTSKHFFGILSGLSMIAWACGSLHAARSVTHYNATWTFAEDHPTGVFANGEPWVVGPVTIVRIVPNSDTATDSGSMRVTIPNTFQGFTGKLVYSLGLPHEGVYYRPDLDVSLAANLPTTFEAGEMLMTATGQLVAGEVRSTTNEICVLTILSETPPEGSFRPSLFSETPRSIKYNKKDINYSILKNLTPVPKTPTKLEIEAYLPALPWFEYDNTWLQSSYGPANNFATNGNGVTYPNSSSVYGREIAYKWGTIALWLNTANSREVKEKAMIQTIQSGLDIASFLEHRGAFEAHGGHKIGRKFPLLLAALALNNSHLLQLSSNPTIFQEDKTTFFVDQSDVGRVVESVEGIYRQEDVGQPDWGILHHDRPFHDDRRWEGGVPYRYVTWPAMIGCVLAADLMDQRTNWNHPAIFAYTERFKERHGLGDGFVGQMWSRYKPSADGSPSATQSLRIKR